MSLVLMSAAHRDNKWDSDVTARSTSGRQLSARASKVIHHAASTQERRAHANVHHIIYATARLQTNVGIHPG